MGRRSINTTKRGKFMNPTDQARKEQRRRELKKNRKQRTIVRAAVLKAKDPAQILTELEEVDKMEFNPIEPPPLNEKVLKEKRRKLRETLDRLIRMYDAEEPHHAQDVRRLIRDYEEKSSALQAYFHTVKNAERVKIDQIPLPDVPVASIPGGGSMQMPFMPPTGMPPPPLGMFPPGVFGSNNSSFPGQYSLPGTIPQSILKKASDGKIVKSKVPPGPPPGTPPYLSSSDDEENRNVDDEKSRGRRHRRHRGRRSSSGSSRSRSGSDDERHKRHVHPRKIRFADDNSWNPNEPEKDTRIKIGYKPSSRYSANDSKGSPSRSGSDSGGDSDKESRKSRKKRHRSSSGSASDDDYKLRNVDLTSHLPAASLAAPSGMIPSIRPPMPSMTGFSRMQMPSGLASMHGSHLMPHQIPPPNLTNKKNAAIEALGVATARIGQPKINLQQSSSQPARSVTTITAKPVIKNPIGDVTRFTPTAVKVKRETRDVKTGRIVKPVPRKNDFGMQSAIRPRAGIAKLAPGQSKDDAYTDFMKEMQGLL